MYKKGDIVFEEGMIADGFYVVKRVNLKILTKKQKQEESSKKFIKKDPFWFKSFIRGRRRTEP